MVLGNVSHDVIPSLSQDEETIMMLAISGESMMPIGRWEKPVEHLVELGFLNGPDRFNAYITNEGKKFWAAHVEGQPQRLASQIEEAHGSITDAIRKCAETLAEAARQSSKATGDRPQFIAKKWSKVILTEALKLLDP
jgi:hypothetical protein